MGNTCCKQVQIIQSGISRDIVSNYPQPNNQPYQQQQSFVSTFATVPRERSHRSNISLSRISQRRESEIIEQIQLQSQQGENVDLGSLFQIYVQLRQGERQVISYNNLGLLLGLLRVLQNIPQSQGLTKEQIKNLTKTKAQNSQSTCPVCQDSINKDQQVIILNCNHPFHVECISQWLQKSNKCPLCRKQTVIQIQS